MIDIELTKVSPWKLNPRSGSSEESLAELAVSIKEVGLLQPIVVRPAHDEDREEMEDPTASYIIVAGERRYRAAILAERTNIEASVHPMSRDQALEVAIVENLQREDISAVEEARAYKSYLDNTEITQAAFAEKIGKSQGHIANRLRLLKLPDDIQGKIISHEITATTARELCTIAEFPKGIDRVLRYHDKQGYDWEGAVKRAGQEIRYEKKTDEEQKAARDKAAPEIAKQIEKLTAEGKIAREGIDPKDDRLPISYDYLKGPGCHKCERLIFLVKVRSWNATVYVEEHCPDRNCLAEQRAKREEEFEEKRRQQEEKQLKDKAPIREFTSELIKNLAGIDAYCREPGILGTVDMRYIADTITRGWRLPDFLKQVYDIMGWDRTGIPEDNNLALGDDFEGRLASAETTFELLRIVIVWQLLEDVENNYEFADRFMTYLKAKGFVDPSEKLEEATVSGS